MDINIDQAKTLLTAAEFYMRDLGRMRDDLVRAGIYSDTANQGIEKNRRDLAKIANDLHDFVNGQ